MTNNVTNFLEWKAKQDESYTRTETKRERIEVVFKSPIDKIQVVQGYLVTFQVEEEILRDKVNSWIIRQESLDIYPYCSESVRRALYERILFITKHWHRPVTVKNDGE